MSKLTEIKIGNVLHLVKETNSGFWLNVKATDPQSATLTDMEVKFMLDDNKQYILNLIPKMQDAVKLIDMYLKDLRNE